MSLSMRFGYLATEPSDINPCYCFFLVSPQVNPNLFSASVFFPFLRAEEREENEVDLYQFV